MEIPLLHKCQNFLVNP